MEHQEQVTRANNNQLGIMDWVWTLLLLVLPVVNIVMLIIWAVDRMNPRRNFAIAYFIIMGVGFVLGILLAIVFTIIGISLIPDTDPTYSTTYTY
ncbi:hypothetical protein SAMN05421503_2237 [Terribacillus aidingensis]|uniref:Uncharacterized protein n=1 Tax=Terribacillus aidingensis TaxID=586416 RepID=A0A285NYM1_9BACI|nr:hypothetical protein [Terribacillus aidingensis]SNZ14127.1 hypothetical protein SAMN05421503_2237 [Terribacillus aidingensis]